MDAQNRPSATPKVTPLKTGRGQIALAEKEEQWGEKEMMQKSSARPSFPNGTHPAQPKAKDGGKKRNGACIFWETMHLERKKRYYAVLFRLKFYFYKR